MREFRTSGSVGAPGEQSPGATRPTDPARNNGRAHRPLRAAGGGYGWGGVLTARIMRLS